MDKDRSSELNELKAILNDNRLNEVFGLKGKYYDKLIECIWNDLKYHNTTLYKNSRFSVVSNPFCKLTIMLLASVLSIFRWLKLRKLLCKDSISGCKTIVVPFAYTVIRFKPFIEIDKSAGLYYPPLWHYDYISKHIDFYQKNNVGIELGCFAFFDIIRTLTNVISHYNCIIKVSAYCDKKYNQRSNKFINIFFMICIYKHYFERRFKKVHDSTNRVWVMDYDLDYKYILLNSIIKQRNPNDITIHQQHGMFWNKLGFEYMNTLSDYDFCCCQREYDMIMDGNNEYNSHVEIMGTPMQCLNRTVVLDSIEEKYDVLLLLTAAFEDKWITIQKVVIPQLAKSGLKVLARFRPASKQNDAVVLKDDLRDINISNGTSLAEDIASSKVVVSFSGDAIYECFRANKRTILVLPEEYYASFFNTPLRSENFKVLRVEEFNTAIVISSLKNKNSIDFKNDAYVLYNLGLFDYDEYIKKYSYRLSELSTIVNSPKSFQ